MKYEDTEEKNNNTQVINSDKERKSIIDNDLAKKYREKWVQNIYNLLKVVAITSIIIILCYFSISLVQDILLKSLLKILYYLSYFIGIISIIFFGIKTAYYSLKEMEIKNSEKDNYTKKNCIIILLITIAIPSIIWIIGSLIEYFLLK